MALAAAIILIGAAPCGASALMIGVGDQSPAMFTSPAFLALHIGEARVNVPWNVATAASEQGDLVSVAGWLQAARAAGVTPLVSFTGNGNYIPTAGQYTAAVRAFVRR